MRAVVQPHCHVYSTIFSIAIQLFKTTSPFNVSFLPIKCLDASPIAFNRTFHPFPYQESHSSNEVNSVYLLKRLHINICKYFDVKF